jgi:hypothetical protein
MFFQFLATITLAFNRDAMAPIPTCLLRPISAWTGHQRLPVDAGGPGGGDIVLCYITRYPRFWARPLSGDVPGRNLGREIKNTAKKFDCFSIRCSVASPHQPILLIPGPRLRTSNLKKSTGR